MNTFNYQSTTDGNPVSTFNTSFFLNDDYSLADLIVYLNNIMQAKATNLDVPKNANIEGDPLATEGWTTSKLLVLDSQLETLISLKRDYLDNSFPASATCDGSPIANQSWVSTQISAAINGLINGAPGTMNTLNELSAAIAAESNVVDALNTIVQTKADTAYVNATFGKLGASNIWTQTQTFLGNLFVNNTTVTPIHLSYISGLTSPAQFQFSQLTSSLSSYLTISAAQQTYLSLAAFNTQVNNINNSINSVAASISNIFSSNNTWSGTNTFNIVKFSTNIMMRNVNNVFAWGLNTCATISDVCASFKVGGMNQGGCAWTWNLSNVGTGYMSLLCNGGGSMGGWQFLTQSSSRYYNESNPYLLFTMNTSSNTSHVPLQTDDLTLNNAINLPSSVVDCSQLEYLSNLTKTDEARYDVNNENTFLQQQSFNNHATFNDDITLRTNLITNNNTVVTQNDLMNISGSGPVMRLYNNDNYSCTFTNTMCDGAKRAVRVTCGPNTNMTLVINIPISVVGSGIFKTYSVPPKLTEKQLSVYSASLYINNVFSKTLDVVKMNNFGDGYNQLISANAAGNFNFDLYLCNISTSFNVCCTSTTTYDVYFSLFPNSMFENGMSLSSHYISANSPSNFGTYNLTVLSTVTGGPLLGSSVPSCTRNLTNVSNFDDNTKGLLQLNNINANNASFENTQYNKLPLYNTRPISCGVWMLVLSNGMRYFPILKSYANLSTTYCSNTSSVGPLNTSPIYDSTTTYQPQPNDADVGYLLLPGWSVTGWTNFNYSGDVSINVTNNSSYAQFYKCVTTSSSLKIYYDDNLIEDEIVVPTIVSNYKSSNNVTLKDIINITFGALKL